MGGDGSTSVLLPCSSSDLERVAGTRLWGDSGADGRVGDWAGVTELRMLTVAGSRGGAGDVGCESRVGLGRVKDSMVARCC